MNIFCQVWRLFTDQTSCFPCQHTLTCSYIWWSVHFRWPCNQFNIHNELFIITFDLLNMYLLSTIATLGCFSPVNFKLIPVWPRTFSSDYYKHIVIRLITLSNCWLYHHWLVATSRCYMVSFISKTDNHNIAVILSKTVLNQTKWIN